MIVNIENTQIKVSLSQEKFSLPQEIKEKIKEFWNNTIKENSNLWNGEQMCVSGYKKIGNEIIVTCKKSEYAHYLYDERIGLPKEYACPSLVAGCLLETSDGYYIVGQLNSTASYPRCLQVSGGSCDNNDIVDGNINIFNTIQREVKEELNIDVQDQNQVKDYEIKYISLPNEKAHTYILFGKGILHMDSVQMKEYYREYLQYLKDNNGEIEFEKLHFIKKENIVEELSKLDNPKREYLLELLEKDSRPKIREDEER